MPYTIEVVLYFNTVVLIYITMLPRLSLIATSGLLNNYMEFRCGSRVFKNLVFDLNLQEAVIATSDLEAHDIYTYYRWLRN